MLLLGICLWSPFLQLSKVKLKKLGYFKHVDAELEREVKKNKRRWDLMMGKLYIYASIQSFHLSDRITVHLFIRLIRSTKPTNCLLSFFIFYFCIFSDSWSSAARWHVRSTENPTQVCLSTGMSAPTLVSDHVSSHVCEKTEERDKTSSLLAFSSPICHLFLSLSYSLSTVFFFSVCLFLLA